MKNKNTTDSRQDQGQRQGQNQGQGLNRDTQSSRGLNTPNTTGAGETSQTPSYGNSDSQQGIKSSNKQTRNFDK